MKTPIRALLIASAVVAVGLSPYSDAALVTNISSGTVEVDTTTGKVGVESWKASEGDEIVQTGGTLNVKRGGTGAGNGLIKSTGGAITFNAGSSNSSKTTLNLATGSIIADAVRVKIESRSRININGGELWLGANDTISASNSEINLNSGVLNYNVDSAIPIKATGGVLNLLGGTMALTGNSSIAEAVVLTSFADSTLKLTGATVHIGSGDSIVGNVEIHSGTLNVSDTKITPSIFLPTNYIQEGGNLNLTNSSLLVNSPDSYISGGKVNLTGSDLTIMGEAPSDDDLANDAAYTLINSTLTLQDGVGLSGGSLTMTNSALSVSDSASVVGETITSTGSTLDFTGSSVLQTSSLTLTDSVLNIMNGQSNSSSVASNITDGGSASFTIGNGSSFLLTGGTIAEAVDFSLEAGTTLGMQGSANLTVDASDTFAGSLEMQGGTLSLTKQNIVASVNNGFNVSGGTLNLDGTSISLDLPTSSITNATMSITNGSKLVFNNVNKLSLKSTSTETEVNEIILQEGSELALIGSDTNINKLTKVVINENSKLTLGMTDDAAMPELTIDNSDIWAGSLEIQKGSLTLDGVTFDSSENVTYYQKGGNLFLNNSNIILDTSSSFIEHGSVSMSNSTLVLNNSQSNLSGFYIDDASTLHIKNGSKAIMIPYGSISDAAKIVLDNGADIDLLAGATLSINENDSWLGTITSNGIMNITGISVVTTPGKKFIQEQIYLDSTVGGELNIKNASLTLNTEDSYINGGVVNLLDSGELVLNNGLTNSAVVNAELYGDEAGTLTISEGATLNITGGSINYDTKLNIDGDVNVTNADFYIDSDTDTWGTAYLNVKSGANVTIHEFNKAAVFSLENGTVSLDSSSITLFDSNLDYLKKGVLNLYNESSIILSNAKSHTLNEIYTDTTANTLTLNNGSDLTVKTGLVEEATKVSIEDGSTLTIEDANLKFDGSTDVLAGELFLKGQRGKVSLRDFKGASAYVSDDSKIYTQDGGTLTLFNTDMSLNTSASLISSGIVNINEASSLTFDNGVTNSAIIYTDDAANDLTVLAGSTVIMIDGMIKDPTKITVEAGGKLILNEATSAEMIIDGNGGERADRWEGSIYLSKGQMEFINLNRTTTSDVLFAQTGGLLTLNDSYLELKEDSYIRGDDYDVASVILKEASTLIFDNKLNGVIVGEESFKDRINYAAISATDDTESSITVKSGSVLGLTTINVNGIQVGTIEEAAKVVIEAGGQISNFAGNLVIDSRNDDWSGVLNMSAGTITLDGIVKATDDTNKYHQAGGELYLKNSTDLTLATPKSTIDGTNSLVFIHDDSTLTLKNGSSNVAEIYARESATKENSTGTLNVLENSRMSMSGGQFDASAFLNVDETSVFAVAGSSIVSLDATTGDIWNGRLALNNGTLNLNNFTSNGYFTSVGGRLNLNGGQLTIEDYSAIGADGALDDPVEIAAGTSVNIGADADVFVNSGKVFISSNDIWTGDIYHRGGVLDYSGLDKNGKIQSTGGTLNVKQATKGTLSVVEDSFISKDTILSLTGSKATIAITDGTVYFDGNGEATDDVWADNTIVKLNGTGTLDFSDISVDKVTFAGTTGNLNIHSGYFKLYGANSAIEQAVNLQLTGGTLDIAGGKAYVDKNDNWSSAITLTSGTLNLIGLENKTTDATVTYNQTAGALNLNNTSLILNESSVISGGSVTFANSEDGPSLLTINNGAINTAKITTSGLADKLNILGGSTLNSTSANFNANSIVKLDGASTLDLTTSTFVEDAQLLLGEGSTLALKGAGSATTNRTAITLDNTDTWAGIIDNNAYSYLIINNALKEATGQLIQDTANASTVVYGTNFALNNQDDKISLGSFTIGDSKEDTVDRMNISKGNVESGATVNLTQYSTLDITGGSLSLNTGDTWKGDIELNGGTFNFANLTSNGKLSGNTGNLNIASGTLTLKEGDYVKEAVNFALNSATVKLDSGILELNDGDIWQGTIYNVGSVLTANGLLKEGIYKQDNVNATLRVLGNGFTLGNPADSITLGSLDVGDEAGTVTLFNMSGGTVADDVGVHIFNNATLNMSGGALTLNSGDYIKEQGKVSVTEGTLTLDGFNLTANYTQTGGTVSLINGSVLNLLEDVGSYIESGTISLNDGSSVTFNNPSIASSVTLLTDTNANNLGINAGTLTLIGSNIQDATVFSLSKGATLVNQSTSTLSLNSGDTWAGTINNLGTLKINGIDKQVGSDVGTLVQTYSGASTTVLGTAFNLNNYDDEISAGAFNIGDGTEVNKATVSLFGTISDGAKVKLTKNSSLIVDGGQLTIDITDNATKDTWAGSIEIKSGSLNIFDFTTKVANDAKLTINGGFTNIHTDYFVSENDSILAGAINLYGSTMALNNNDIHSGIALLINNSSNLVIDEGSVVSIDANDNWLGSIANNGGILNLSKQKETSDTSKYTQKGGNLNITSNTLALAEGSSITSDATLGEANITLENGGGIIFNNLTTNAAKLISGNPFVMMLDNTNNIVTVSNGTTLDLLSGSIISGDTVVDFSGTVNLASGGNVTLNTGDILAGTLTNNGSIVNLVGVNKTGSYIQNSGQTNIYSALVLNSTDAINAGGLLIDNNSTLTTGAEIADAVIVELASGSILDIQSGANVVLNSTGTYADVVNGAVKNAGTLTASGFTINSYTHNNGSSTFTNSTITADGVVTGGNINLDNSTVTAGNSITNTAFTLGNKSSLVSNGGVVTGSNISLNGESVLLINNGSTTNSISLNTDTSANKLELTNNSALEVTSGDILAQTIVNLTEGSALKVGASSVAIDDSEDAWLGTIELLGTNSTLNLQDYDAKPVGILIADKGNINLLGTTKIALGAGSDIKEDVALSIGENAELTLSGASLTMDSHDGWDGTIKMSEASTTLTLLDLETGVNSKLEASKGSLVLDNSTLNLGSGSEVASAVGINIQSDSTLNVAGGDLYFDGSSVDGNVADIWDGVLSVGSGNLYLSNISNGAGAVFKQTNGNVYLDNSTLNLAVGSSISNGSVDMKNGSTLDINNGETTNAIITTDANTNTIGLTSGTLNLLEGSNVGATTDVVIGTGTTLNINGALTSFVLNNGDTWEGTLSIGSGNLYLTEMTNGANAVFKQTNGNVYLDNSILNLAVGSSISNGSVDMKNGSTLNINNGETTNAIITTDTNANILSLSNGTLNLTGGNINEATTVTIGSGTTLNVANGTLTLDGATDDWDGTLTINGGDLVLKDMVKDVAAIYQQNSGTTTVFGSTFDMNNSNDKVAGGSLLIGELSKVTVSAGTISENATIVLKDGAELNILANGSTNEGNTSTGPNWDGHVKVDGGKLTITDNDATANKEGYLTQSNGEIVIAGNGFELNDSRDNLSGGKLTINNGSKLTVSNGTIGAGSELDIKGTLSLSGGNVTVTTGDVWDGLLEMLEGGNANLTLDSYTGSNKLVQQSGILTLDNASNFTLAEASSITGGTVNVSGASTLSTGESANSVIKNIVANLADASTLEIKNGSQDNSINFLSDSSANTLRIDRNSALKILTGDVTANNKVDIKSGSKISIADGVTLELDTKAGSADNWEGTVALDDAGASLKLVDYIGNAGTLTASVGNVKLEGSTNLNLAGGTIADLVNLSIASGTTLNLDGASLTMDTLDDWSGTIEMANATSTLILQGMTTGDDANLIATAGNLVLDDSTLTVGVSSNIANGVALDIQDGSNVKIKGGNLILDSQDKWDGVVELDTAGGTLNIDAPQKGSTGVLVQNGGGVNLASAFVMENSEDKINAGIFNAVGNDLTIKNGLVDATAQMELANVTIEGGVVALNGTDTFASIAMSNGDVTIDSVTAWTSANSVSQSNGNLTIKGYDEVNKNGKINSSGGTLTIENGTLTVATGSGIAEGTTLVINSDSTAIVDGGDFALDSADTWNGTVKVQSGTFDIKVAEADKNGALVQNGGIINLLQNFVMNDDNDAINAGSFNAGGNALTVNTGLIAKDAEMTLANVTVKGGNVTLNGSDSFVSLGVQGGDVTLDSLVAWDGSVSHSAGNLTIKGFDNVNKNGQFTSTGGILTVDTGRLTIASGSNVSGDTTFVINNGTTAFVDGGNATIDGADTWNGNVTLNSGNLTIDGVTKTTDASSSYTQTGGTLELNESTLELGTGSSIASGIVNVTDSTLEVGAGASIADAEITLAGSIMDVTGGELNGANTIAMSGSELNLANGKETSVSIITTGDDNKLALAGNDTKLNLTGGNINEATTVTIGSGTTLNVANGTLTLDGATDDWDGTLTINGGDLVLKDMVKDVAAIYQQNSGTTTVFGSTFDMNNSNDKVAGGSLLIGELSKVTVSAGTISENATIVLKDGAELNILANGSTNEGNTSTGPNWDGHVKVDGGKLTITDNDATANKEGYLTQSNGEIVIAGNGFELNDSRDNLSGGKLTINNGSKLTVSNGTIGAGSELDIKGTLSLSGGNVTVTTGDVWDGLLEMLEGNANLTLDNATKTTGTLTQAGGKTTILGDFDLNNSGDLISGGELVIENGQLTISQGSVIGGVDITSKENTTIAVSGGNLELNKDDIWNGKVTVSSGNLTIADVGTKGNNATIEQSGGNVVVAKDFNMNNANDKIASGNLTIKNGANLTVSNGNIDSDAVLDIESGAGLVIDGGNATINNDTWNGDVTLNSGTLSLNQDKTTDANTKFNQAGGTLDLSANLTLSSGSKIENGIVNLTNAELTFDNASSNKATITTDNNSKLAINSGSLELAGGEIKDSAVLELLGAMAIAGDSKVTIGGDDNWSGNLTLANADAMLTLNTNKVTSATSTYNQTAGNLTINTSTLELLNGSGIAGGNVELNNSNLVLGAGSEFTSAPIVMNNASSVEFNNGRQDNTATITDDGTGNKIAIQNGSGFNVIGGAIKKETDLDIYGNLGIKGGAEVTVDGFDTWAGKISLADGTLILDSVSTAGSFEAQSGTLKIQNSDISLGSGLAINKGVTTVLDSTSKLNINGGDVTFDANNASKDTWSGEVKLASGSMTLTDGFKHNTANGVFSQTSGILTINNDAELSLADSLSAITGTSELLLGDKGVLTIANGQENTAKMTTSGNSSFKLANASTFNMATGSDVVASTNVDLGAGTSLNLKTGKLALDNTDNWQGKVNLAENGQLTLVNKTSSVGASGDITTNMLEQAGGTLSLKNTVLALYEDTNDILKSGKVELDKYSRVNLASAWDNSSLDIRTAGTISSMNNAVEANSLGALLIDNVNGRSDFAIDIYEDVQTGSYTTDTFEFTSIAGVNPNRESVVNISDWNLVSSVQGNPLAFNKTVDLGKVFDTTNLGENVKFTATADEVVTPVSRYALKADPANDGSYFLDIVGYNSQSYRGQVASVSQLMNQLVINDILFDRMLLTPQTLVPTNFANKSAYLGQAGVPAYTYSRKDPGLWVKSYGNFEHLRMTNDLKVENNAYGSLIGADLGTFELSNGWNWIPTIYMGYNGAHQNFDGVSMYENGGQVGAMGTFFNKDWITSVLAYASMYNMEMSMNGFTDEEFNFYAGTAVKSAYNWRIKDHLVIQPSATVSYNFFGGPKWQSSYGQIGMTAGTLNGLNVAPGVNFIWQQDTWSLFATVAYVYNCMGRVSGSAAGVDLPEVWMKRGYLQYGFGASKEITDRFSAYAQIILRNVGRTGIGFQGELLYKF